MRPSAGPAVAVAASGGRDSTALLHATLRAARPLGARVLALHVHHGLNPAADEWQRHLQRQCARWSRSGWPVEFHARRLSGSPARGESIEAWARRERYGALAAMAREHGAELVLLAHHRRDQAETFLLQALRGAGPAGLAAMPRQAERDAVLWCRPWLEQPGEAIAAYVARHRLSHIHDDSNDDRRFDRNRLRHDVWPALLAAFPHAEAALAGAAARSHSANEIAQEAARAALAELAASDRAAHGLDALDVPRWLQLSPARRRAALAAWLAGQRGGGVSDSLVERLLEQLPRCATGRWPLAPGRELRLYRGRLAAAAAVTMAPVPPVTKQVMRLDRAGRIDLPAWGGQLEISAVTQGGVAASLMAQAELRDREPRDQFQLAARSVARSLKKQYQARAVPAWQRAGPVVVAGGRIVFVPGLGIDARVLAAPGEPQLALSWRPRD